MLLDEELVLDALPAGHDTSASAHLDFTRPVTIELVRRDLSMEATVAGEGEKVDAALTRMLSLRSRYHMMETSMHEVAHQSYV